MMFDQGIALFAEQASLRDLEEVAEFCGVVPGTVLGWTTGGAPPKGEAQMRMMYYLLLRGVELRELRELPRPAFDLGMYIALKVLSVDEATSLLEYANKQELYRLLRGAELQSERARLLAEILESYRDAATANGEKLTFVPFAEQRSGRPLSEAAETHLSTTKETDEVPFVARHVSGALLTASALTNVLPRSDRNLLACIVALTGEEQIVSLIDALGACLESADESNSND